MSILVSEITAEAGRLLHDTGQIRWSQDELIEYLDDAQKAVVLLRPEATRTEAAVLLAAGAKQSLPSDGYRFLSVGHNMGTTGKVPGRHIYLVDKSALDRHDPGWRAGVPATEIDEYCVDPPNTLDFYVNPPAHPSTPVYVWLAYSKYPTRLRRTTEIPAYNSALDTISVADIYKPPLLEYVLMRANRKLTEAAAEQREAKHGQAFLSMMGAQQRTDVLHNPSMRDRPYDDRPPRPQAIQP